MMDYVQEETIDLMLGLYNEFYEETNNGQAAAELVKCYNSIDAELGVSEIIQHYQTALKTTNDKVAAAILTYGFASAQCRENFHQGMDAKIKSGEMMHICGAEDYQLYEEWKELRRSA